MKILSVKGQYSLRSKVLGIKLNVLSGFPAMPARCKALAWRVGAALLSQCRFADWGAP